MANISWKFAYRNLSRNFHRTLLSVLGVGIGCGIALINVGMVKGKSEVFIRSVAEGGVGHLRVEPAGWLIGRDPKLRLKDWEKELTNLRQNPRVEIATPRTRVQGLLAMGTHLVGAEIVGVDPQTEPRTFRYVQNIASGRYLLPSDHQAIVIGGSIADRLRVEVDDQIVLTVVSKDGSLQNLMFTTVGIVRTGSKDVDSLICQVNLPDLAALSGTPGAGEIAILLKDPLDAVAFQQDFKDTIPSGDILLNWQEISPQTKTIVKVNEGMANIVTGVLVLVALLGIAGAQLTAILERQKEFSVLLAVGMKGSQILRLILLEAFALGLLGAISTVVLSGPFIFYLAKHGIKVSDTSKGGMTMSGALIDPVIHSGFGMWIISYAFFLSLLSTLLASLYPAWFATRLDPAAALRVSQ